MIHILFHIPCTEVLTLYGIVIHQGIFPCAWTLSPSFTHSSVLRRGAPWTSRHASQMSKIPRQAAGDKPIPHDEEEKQSALHAGVIFSGGIIFETFACQDTQVPIFIPGLFVLWLRAPINIAPLQNHNTKTHYARRECVRAVTYNRMQYVC